MYRQVQTHDITQVGCCSHESAALGVNVSYHLNHHQIGNYVLIYHCLLMYQLLPVDDAEDGWLLGDPAHTRGCSVSLHICELQGIQPGRYTTYIY